MTIKTLLIDDSEETLIVLAIQYSAFQEVEVVGQVTSTAEALKILENEPIDMISIDLLIGNESGTDLAKKVISTYPDVFVVICSMEDNDLEKIKSKPIGIEFFLTKPTSHEDIQRLLEQYHEVKKDTQHSISYSNSDSIDNWMKQVLKDI